jgi:hypothetical protein
MTEEKKRGRGRPKKEEKVENPDCEPATKGFVKCLMRKYDNGHTHKQRGGGLAMIALALLFGVVWLACVTMPNPSMGANQPLYAWMFGSLAAVSVVAAYEIASIGEGRTTEPNNTMWCTHPEYIRKYEPPTCEPKKECE